MPNRYKTKGEIAGAKRRSAAYRQRLREAGLHSRNIWLTDPENSRVRAVVARWRGEEADLTEEQAAAADVLKPEK